MLREREQGMASRRPTRQLTPHETQVRRDGALHPSGEGDRLYLKLTHFYQEYSRFWNVWGQEWKRPAHTVRRG